MSTKKRSSQSKGIMPNVVKVLDLILMATEPQEENSKPYSDIYTDIANQMRPIGVRAKSIGKQCVGLANIALSSHRYYEALKLLCIICQDPTVIDMFIFRASMLVLENLDIKDHQDVVWKLISEIQNMNKINKKEVQLEYFVHELTCGLTHDSLELEERFQLYSKIKENKFLKRKPILDPIIKGYMAYLDCIPLCHVLSNSVETDLPLQTLADAERNILKLYSLLDIPGDWDIFVLKLVEILNKYELVANKKLKEKNKEVNVEKVLRKYAEKNPDNLNAHIYFSLYLNDSNPESPELIHHLEKISEMSPSDERVLILLQKLEDFGKKLEKCFMFLDYPSNGKNQNAWNMLLEFLCDAEKRNDDKDLHTIQTCWIPRRKSWNFLYFNPCKVSLLKNAEPLVVLKVNILLHLDKDHEFIKNFFKKFPS